ncbi:hypothetical protein [Dokdonella fugitiva]|jgi:hypothetical protein|uniref:SH3 domain-containing protein n=1 Tax=Dokdonella fugitiva TaxID=328517 RepID=A0A4R2I275_9GAMM|nr:hypothetical protein [Dokdonella fugitiva]TCO36525.1 hypothetical protein EV148_1129 [Dokdonella fugitiva]
MKTMLLIAALSASVAARAAEPAKVPALPEPNPTAIVVIDQAALRAAPRGSAQQQVVLWQGDSLEVRGHRLDYLQVYDHRRERAGYVRASEVRILSLRTGDAAGLLAVVRFLRDTPGAEALGIAYAAAYLRAAPAQDIDAEAFDALGTMADRLARRASSKRRRADDAAIAAHLEVVAYYGVAMRSLERDGRVHVCYDGDAFRRVMALPADAQQKARAALALTREECIDPATTPFERASLDGWRADVLDRVPRADLPGYLKNRLRMRAAAVWSSLAFERVRRGEPATEAAARALQELTGVNRQELADDDLAAYSDAAVRVGAVRWAAEPVSARLATTGLAVKTAPGQPGETCIRLVDAKHGEKAPLLQRCTYGTVWTNSARANGTGTALTLAVQPLDAWREMWVFHRVGDDWTVDVVPPAGDAPEIGYVEFAGWVPGGRKLLAAREVRIGGRFSRTFEVLDLATLAIDKRADKPSSLSTFYRWQDPLWKGQTVSLR